MKVKALVAACVAGIAEFFRRDLGFAAFNIEYRLASAKNPCPACGRALRRIGGWQRNGEMVI